MLLDFKLELLIEEIRDCIYEYCKRTGGKNFECAEYVFKRGRFMSEDKDRSMDKSQRSRVYILYIYIYIQLNLYLHLNIHYFTAKYETRREAQVREIREG